jgi:glutamate carboxypeptidase
MKSDQTRRSHLAALATAALFAANIVASPASSETVTAIQDLAKQEQPLLLNTLRDLVSIESGSRDLEGLAQLANLIADHLKQLGGRVEVISPTDIYRMDDTPEKTGSMVQAQFQGEGKAKILLIAHMDTVYLRGMLKDQPFRVEGDKAYGLGIADDKQGIATILHSVALLQKLGFKNYSTLTVLINGDEEISSPGSRSTITRVAAEQDVVLSFEAGGMDGGLRLATSGIGAAYLSVQGKSSHAGARPEGGINALVELSHQILQLKDLSQTERGLKLNWTMSQAGSNRNVIPAQATAQADARALKVADFDELQATLQQRVKNQLLPEAKVQLKFEVRRPPLEVTDASRRISAHGKEIYREIGLPLPTLEVAAGGGTDAAFAALKTKGAVVEGVGLSGFGAHSNDAEYILINSIVPRLYLVTRLIMDIAEGKVK